MPTDTDLDRDAIAEVLQSAPITLAVLYGSYARGDPDRRSDVDVAVRFEPGVSEEKRRELLDEITAALVTSIGIDEIDLVDLDGVPARLGYRILREGDRLLGESADAAALEARLLLEKLDFEPVLESWQRGLETRIAEGRYGRA